MHVLFKTRLLDRDLVGSDRHERKQIATVFAGDATLCVMLVSEFLSETFAPITTRSAGGIFDCAHELGGGLLSCGLVRAEKRYSEHNTNGNWCSDAREGCGFHGPSL